MIRPPVFFPKKGFRKPNAQEQALKEWRRVDLREAEGTKSSEKGIGQLIPQVVQKIGLERKRSELEVLKVWNNLIDPRVTAHAQPVNLVRGTLFVSVDNSVWLDEIVRYRRKEILSRLQNAFGTDLIQKISYRVG